MAGGKVIIDSSCAGGAVTVSGTGAIENNSLLVVDDTGLNNEDTAWGAIATNNNVSGTMGNKLNTASSGGVDLNALVDAVWGAPDAEYVSASIEWLQKTINNKRAIIKEATGWKLVIYDDDGVTPILQKALKDKDGAQIADLSAGVLAQEGKSSV
jgi:hypothetical protein